MTKLICVSGDSFTQEYWQQPSDRWSSLIGAMDNIAMGGAGNERIFYTTLEYLNKNNPDVLIVGWTSTARGSLFHQDGGRLIITPIRCFHEETGKDYQNILEFYYKNLHNNFVNFRNTLNYMIFLQNYCKNNGIKLLYFRSVMGETLDDLSLGKIASEAYMSRADKNIEKMGIQYNLNLLKDLISKLDKNIWVKEFWFSMMDYIWSNFDIKEYGDGKPLPKEAVKSWAEIIKTHL